ncbi:hypothetical protein [Parachitinimonas caeni]|uniref:DUF5648 domain-containing protein n=1 Tax=Parachitinimonas caeni TaxID=3031301 RepID=A0ABT7E2X2_9NEIS|nr:hypothetical protein [Parachitinimonas caeni]MDK2126650.1 hypothetical protein [Parachitinimonas caeni]
MKLTMKKLALGLLGTLAAGSALAAQYAPLHRYAFTWRPEMHYYTLEGDSDPIVSGIRAQWRHEGIVGYMLNQMIPIPSGSNFVPLLSYQHRNPNGSSGHPTTQDFFLTANPSEIPAGYGEWEFKGYLGACLKNPTPETKPLYRYFNPSVRFRLPGFPDRSSAHFYTSDVNELGGGAYGWYYEGIVCHIFKNDRGTASAGLNEFEAPDTEQAE